MRLSAAPGDALGPLGPFFVDPAVSEILCNGPGFVWVEREGVLAPTETVVSAADLERIIERVLAPLGRRADRSMPWAEGRLADGSRVHVVVPPIAIDGPYIAIRRFAPRGFALAELADAGHVAQLRRAVAARRSLLVVGAAGAGKTTLLNALAGLIEPGERIVTIEDAAELRLAHPHVVRLESRPANGDAAGEVPVRELLRTALRLRPDRLVVGEVRGPEALDLVHALHTGHRGSLATLHANGTVDALRRLEALALSAPQSPPLPALRSMLASAVGLVVVVERDPSGRRRVRTIGQPALVDGDWHEAPADLEWEEAA